MVMTITRSREKVVRTIYVFIMVCSLSLTLYNFVGICNIEKKYRQFFTIYLTCLNSCLSAEQNALPCSFQTMTPQIRN